MSSSLWKFVFGLFLAGFILSAGCLGSDPEPSPMDINISNQTDATISVNIQIKDEENYGMYNETITMGPNSNERLEDLVKTVGIYRLKITLGDGRMKEMDVGVDFGLGLVGVSISEDSIIIGQKVV